MSAGATTNHEETSSSSSSSSIGMKWPILGYLKKTQLSEIEFVLFAFCMMLGNRTGGWNGGLLYGYQALAFNFLVSAAGYFALCLCMGEMASALPFSGGAYGFVRAALGPYLGFLVACCEFVYCTTYTVIIVSRLLNLSTLYGGGSVSSENYTITVFVLYIICFILCIAGGRVTFTITNMIGLFILIILIIYLLATFALFDTNQVSFIRFSMPVMHPMTWDGFMSSRMSAGAQFNGMQYFSLLSSLLPNPKEQVPRLMLITVLFFLLATMFITLAAISQDSDNFSMVSAPLPLIFGYAKAFPLHYAELKWLFIPCQFGSILGLFYCSGKQIHALSKSGMMPTFLDKTIPVVETPYLCFALSGVVGMLVSMYVINNPESLVSIRGLSLIATFLIFIVFFVAYMVFRRKFASLERGFVNPFGDATPIFGIINFLFASAGILFYQGNNRPIYLAGLAGYLLLGTIFFWTYLVKNQKFSDEEKQLMFKAYLINANRNARLNRLKNNKVRPNKATTASKTVTICTGNGKSVDSGGNKSHLNLNQSTEPDACIKSMSDDRITMVASESADACIRPAEGVVLQGFDLLDHQV